MSSEIKVKPDGASEEEHAAAVKIQSMYRGHKVRAARPHDDKPDIASSGKFDAVEEELGGYIKRKDRAELDKVRAWLLWCPNPYVLTYMCQTSRLIAVGQRGLQREQQGVVGGDRQVCGGEVPRAGQQAGPDAGVQEDDTPRWGR